MIVADFVVSAVGGDNEREIRFTYFAGCGGGYA